jgi:hypothetical protein
MESEGMGWKVKERQGMIWKGMAWHGMEWKCME